MTKKKTLVTLGSAGIIIIIIIIAQRLGLLTPINNLVNRLFSPLAGVGYWVGDLFSNDSHDGKSAAELHRELEKIQAENRDLLAKEARWAEIEQENNSLKEMLQYRQAITYTLVTSRVIARGPREENGKEQTITLDQGRDAGVVPGLPLVDTEGVLIGRVVDAKDRIAEGCLLFKDSCRVAVGIQGQAGTVGVIQSDLRLALKVDFIPHDRKIEVGQMIVTSGLEEHIPAGLVVGRISEVIKEGNELWQHALVEPVGNFDTLKVVGILKL